MLLSSLLSILPSHIKHGTSLITHFVSCITLHTLTLPASYHEMLKEPGAHDVGGMFGQNPSLVFGLLVFAVQQGRQVHVYLQNRHQEGKRT